MLGLFPNKITAEAVGTVAGEREVYEVLWPRGEKPSVIGGLAKRLDTLSGKTVGELWDWVFRGEVIFPVIEAELTKRYPGVRFVPYTVFGLIHGGEEAQAVKALPGKLKETGCDAVISGVGC